MFTCRYLLSFSWRCCERTRKLVQVVKYFSNDRDCREVLGDESFCGPNFATNVLTNLSVPGQPCSFPSYCTPTGWLTMNPETQCSYHWKKAVCLSFRLSVHLPPYCLLNRTHILVDLLWIPKHNFLIIEKKPWTKPRTDLLHVPCWTLLKCHWYICPV